MKHVLVVPDGIELSEERCFIRLPNPRTGLPALYLPANDGLLEVQRVSPSEGRTWFVDQTVVSDGSLVVLSPIDPILLITSILERLPGNLFREESDIWESACTLKPDEDADTEWDMLAFGALDCVKARLSDVCDTQALDGQPDGKLYRLSTDKVLARLRAKVNKMIDTQDGIFGAYELETLGEQTGQSKEYSTITRALVQEGFGDGRGTSIALQKELRIKTSLGILSAYLSPPMLAKLVASYTFTLTNASQSAVELSADYLPGRSNSNASDNVAASRFDRPAQSGKKGAASGSMSAAARAKEAQKKADKNTSRGVKELRKVSTRGMNKINSFFTKKAAPAAAPAEDAATDGADTVAAVTGTAVAIDTSET